MTDASSVVFDQTTKVFGNVNALDSLSLDVPRGCIYGFIGPNGAGKTTAMRLLLGITKPTEGTVSVLGESDGRLVRSRIGYLPEEKGLYKRMKVVDFIVYMGRLNGMNRKVAQSRAEALLSDFDLSDWTKEKCQTLSKGMGQKVQLIATLVHDPDLLVLDEPFSGLDPINTDFVRSLILDRVKANATVILSTHIMEQAETLCNALVLINKGRAVIEGSIDEVRSGDTVYLEHDQGEEVLQNLPGVASVKQIGREASIRIEQECDTQALLQEILRRTKVVKFDTSSASLHEVFIRHVGEDEMDSEAEQEGETESA